MDVRTLSRPQDWPIAAKLTTFTLAIGVGAIAVLGLLQSRNIASTITERQVATLNAVMDERAERVEQEFSFLQEQLVGFAEDPLIRTASDSLTPAFQQLAAQSDITPDTAKAELARYFDRQYKPRLEKAGLPYRGAAQYTPASPDARIAQYLYLPANPNPVGAKHQYDRAPQDTDYNELHAQYHPIIRRYLDTFGAYDIFLVAPEGDIVYSVYKETDYATNLANGPYSETGLAEAYREARSLREGQYYTTDYSPYEPSYGDAAIFLSSPVFNDGELVAIACMQMPVPKLNKLVAAPIGETGRTRLIGNDLKIRSVLDENDTVMTTTMETDGARLAAEGESGHTVHTASSGKQALAVYRPLNIDGLQWNMIGEADMSEVLAPASAMRNQLMVQAAITAVVIVPLAFLFARSLSRPIRAVAQHTARLASGDFSAKIAMHRRDELGQLAAATDDMSGQIGTMVSDVTACAHEVAGAATEIAATSEQMSHGLQQQQSQTNDVSNSTDELSSLAKSVAEKSSSASEAAECAGKEAEGGGVVVGETVAEMQTIAEQVRQAAESVSALGAKSEQIGEIITVINEIAEQTNMLALNAAIEAARAGEHGRGFAVVADEVRKLAERTRVATEQVANSIREIQTDTHTSVERIEEGSSRALSGVEKASDASASFERIVGSFTSLKGMVSEIAHAVQEQSEGTGQIAQATSNIDAISSESTSAANQAAEAASNLSQRSEQLLSLTSKFKV